MLNVLRDQRSPAHRRRLRAPRRRAELPVSYPAAPLVTDDGVTGAASSSSRTSRDARAHDAAAARCSEADDACRGSGRIQDALRRRAASCSTRSRSSTSRTGERSSASCSCACAHGDGSLIAPGDVPARRPRSTALIRDIDRWVIAQGGRLAARGIDVEINISAAVDRRPRAARRHRARAGAHRAPTRALVFEITETALIERPRSRRPGRAAARARLPASRSTTSAPATAASPTSSTCRWTSSRSTASSSATLRTRRGDQHVVRAIVGARPRLRPADDRRGRRGPGDARAAARARRRPRAGLPPSAGPRRWPRTSLHQHDRSRSPDRPTTDESNGAADSRRPHTDDHEAPRTGAGLTTTIIGVWPDNLLGSQIRASADLRAGAGSTPT